MTPTLADRCFKQFREELAEVLEDEFVKGECKERGKALVLYSFAVILFERLLAEFGDEVARHYEIKVEK